MRLHLRMFRLVLPALALLTSQVQARAQHEKTPTIGRIERLDPRFDALVPKDARVERIAEGFNWAEGPLWVPDEGGYLLFSDTEVNTVFKWTKADGVKEFLKPSGYTGSVPRPGEPGSNGLLRDPDGNLVLMQHGDRRVARLEGGKFVTIADKYQGKRFNSPNDGVFKSNGDLYFTDPPYGLVKSVDDPARELDFQGVYRVSKDGTVTLLTRELSRPNGIGFSPDESTLYVSNSDPEHAVWMAYSVKDDGTLGPGRVFFDATKMAKTKKGLPDGLSIDAHGNLFAAGPGGLLVFAPDGTHLGTFDTGLPTGNCEFGEDGSTLFITIDMYVGRVRLTTKGKGF